jgi:sarcosine oxidase
LQQKDHFDVIVIGVGSMGAAACYFMAQRGHRVLGLEQFNIPHERGSHAGQSRIVRMAYYEHPDYVPLLQRAYEHWRTLKTLTGAPVYYRTGIFYSGPPHHPTMSGIRASSDLYHVPVEKLSAEQQQNDFPAFRLPSDFQGLFEPDAGFVLPGETIRRYTDLAIDHGATILTETPVLRWALERKTLRVITQEKAYTCDKLIVTTGSWTAKLLPMLRPELKVTRQVLAWVKPERPELFEWGKFPCWFITDPDRGIFYGFPSLPPEKFEGPYGLKIAHHHPGEPWDADDPKDTIPEGAEENIRYALRKYFAGAGENIVTMKRCLYTYSRDENFIIDYLPGTDKRVTVACGFSGHGFKFVPVVGEILADLALKGATDLPIGFLRLRTPAA